MGTTPNYALPYPDDGSSVNVPRDVRALADGTDTLLKGRFVSFTPEGLATVTAGGVARPLPFSQASGFNNCWFDAVNFAVVVLTFPAGRFTAPPAIGSSSDDAQILVSHRFASTASFQLQMLNLPGAITGNRWATWIALQSLPTGYGLVREATAPTATATCRIAACANVNIPLAITTDVVDPVVVCGVCGQPITDVVPI